MTDATKLQPLLPKNPSVWVRRNGAPFTSGVAHFGRVCPPGWVGAAEPYYSEAEKEAARAPLLAEIEALRKRAEDAERAIAWVPMHERPPEPDTECAVMLRYSHIRPMFASIDRWKMLREAPTGMGGPTMEVGYGWADNDESDVIAWMPIPKHPPEEWDQRIDAAIKGGAA